ncbi:MAG TPA: hypothetical protein VFD88_13295 [Clostridia bacterium]|nr:hypothetical protein [Clostridia bacterium]
MKHPAAPTNLRTMHENGTNDTRIRARDAASRLLNRITTGIAIGALTSVGAVAAVTAYTIPGVASSTQVASTGVSNSGGSTSTGVQSSSSGVSSSSGSGVAVSGGS